MLLAALSSHGAERFTPACAPAAPVDREAVRALAALARDCLPALEDYALCRALAEGLLDGCSPLEGPAESRCRRDFRELRFVQSLLGQHSELAARCVELFEQAPSDVVYARRVEACALASEADDARGVCAQV